MLGRVRNKRKQGLVLVLTSALLRPLTQLDGHRPLASLSRTCSNAPPLAVVRMRRALVR